MQALPQVKYPVMFPYNTLGFERIGETSPLDGLAMVNVLTFVLTPEYSILPSFALSSRNENVPWKKYLCMGCKLNIDVEWFTRVFEGRDIPDTVEREMHDHAKQHAQLGGWGIIEYRKMGK